MVSRSRSVNGYTPAPRSSSTSVVDPSSANPNSAINQRGNLDGDRGFHLKALFGYRLFDRVWAFLSIRHRDGQPFAFLDAKRKEGQIALVQSEKRGSPLDFERPLSGPREDFQLDITAKLSLELAVSPATVYASILAANLFDFGNEPRVAQAYAIAVGGAEHLGIGTTVHARHHSCPMTLPWKP